MLNRYFCTNALIGIVFINSRICLKCLTLSRFHFGFESKQIFNYLFNSSLIIERMLVLLQKREHLNSTLTKNIIRLAGFNTKVHFWKL